MYRHEWYQSIYDKFPAIEAGAVRYAEENSLAKFSDQLGLYSGSSSCPARLPNYVLDAIVKANQAEIVPVRDVEDRVRSVVKDLYGDEYDSAVGASFIRCYLSGAGRG